MLAEMELITEEAEEFVPPLEDSFVLPDHSDDAGLSEAILHIEQE